MAADVEGFENDEQWLYGDNTEGNAPDLQNNATDFTEDVQGPPNEPTEPVEDHSEAPGDRIIEDDGPPGMENEPETENAGVENDAEDGELKQNGDDEDLDDDSDDDVNVVIGEIKTNAPYAPVNIKRGGLTTTIGDKNKTINQIASKFNVEEFEQIGTINGVPANDYNIDTIEDKPWRKPGADITDYFNYGFNEDTWKAYCERQKRIRVSETGVGIVPLNAIGLPSRPMNVMMNDNNKYNHNPNFIGMNNIRPPMQPKPHEPPKMNTIQVMTADRREYSRKPNAFPDMSVPPPAGAYEPFEPAYGFNPEPEPFYGYEPTQDSQWAQANPNWAPSDIKTLTGAPPQMCPPPHGGLPMGPPHSRRDVSPSQRYSPSRRSPSRDRERDRERESRSRSERPRDHDREKSRRRERSRSKSRKHRSRSRSPGHRSHKKKKSRRHEDSD